MVGLDKHRIGIRAVAQWRLQNGVELVGDIDARDYLLDRIIIAASLALAGRTDAAARVPEIFESVAIGPLQFLQDVPMDSFMRARLEEGIRPAQA